MTTSASSFHPSRGFERGLRSASICASSSFKARLARVGEELVREVAREHQERDVRVQLGARGGEAEQLVLAILQAGRVVDQQDGRRAVLEGVGGLVPEGGEVRRPLAVERAVVLVLLRLAAEDQDGLPLDVEAGVVVVVELLRRRPWP